MIPFSKQCSSRTHVMILEKPSFFFTSPKTQYAHFFFTRVMTVKKPLIHNFTHTRNDLRKTFAYFIVSWNIHA